MQKVGESNVLVVGAGGIGCELLKNLVMWNFKKITVVDLDTIDVSNLNRQFLFRRRHVGGSKSITAKESVLHFNSDVEIEALCTNIMNKEFDLDFYKKFNVVLNALDNKVARNHVNRMCIQADIPLIEGGTMGYRGQVQIILKGKTACYECYPKPTQKQYPACTIRNTPSEPIHCVIWAKFLFNQLFGETDMDEDVVPDVNDPELLEQSDSKIIDCPNSNGDSSKEHTNKVNIRNAWRSDDKIDPASLLKLLFQDSISSLLSMSALWKKDNRKKPMILNDNCVNIDSTEAKKHISQVTGGIRDQELLSLEDWCSIFKYSSEELAKRQNETDDHILTWDKDDSLAMDFVASTTNIRMHLFHILPILNRFTIKSMAGNIIPAIATTNAIIAGISVLHAYRVLNGQGDKCRDVMVSDFISARGKIIQSADPLPPVADCYTCSSEVPSIEVVISGNKMESVSLLTLRSFLQQKLDLKAPNVMLHNKPVVIIDGEEDDDEIDMVRYSKTLDQFKLENGSMLRCSDYLYESKDGEKEPELIITLVLRSMDTSDQLCLSQEHINLVNKVFKKTEQINNKRKMNEDVQQSNGNTDNENTKEPNTKFIKIDNTFQDDEEELIMY